MAIAGQLRGSLAGPLDEGCDERLLGGMAQSGPISRRAQAATARHTWFDPAATSGSGCSGIAGRVARWAPCQFRSASRDRDVRLLFEGPAVVELTGEDAVLPERAKRVLVLVWVAQASVPNSAAARLGAGDAPGAALGPEALAFSSASFLSLSSCSLTKASSSLESFERS